MVVTKKVPHSKRDVYKELKHQNEQSEQDTTCGNTGNADVCSMPEEEEDTIKTGIENNKAKDTANSHVQIQINAEEYALKNKKPQDTTDDATRNLKNYILINISDIVFKLISIVTYVLDVGSDIWLCNKYFQNGHNWWFVMTLTFIVMPAITMTLFSLWWYIDDHRHEYDTFGVKVSGIRWVSRFTCLLLQLAPIIRYTEVLLYIWRSKAEKDQKKKRTWYKLMLYEDTDSAILRLIECFMEAAPQLVLQLYIMTQLGVSGSLAFALPFVIITSLGSMAWSLCSYHRALRNSLEDKAKMNICGSIMQFLWYFCIIASRVLALAMFASVFKLWVFSIVGTHWILMWTCIWITTRHTQFCHNIRAIRKESNKVLNRDKGVEEIFFTMVVALVYIFCFVNVFQGHTRLYYIFYYFIMYLENLGMVVSWYFETESQGVWYHLPVLVCVLVGFFVAITIQCIYYRCCHPNNMDHTDEFSKIKSWLDWNEMTNKATYIYCSEKELLFQTQKAVDKCEMVGPIGDDGKPVITTTEGKAGGAHCSSEQMYTLLSEKEAPRHSDEIGFDTVDECSGKSKRK